MKRKPRITIIPQDNGKWTVKVGPAWVTGREGLALLFPSKDRAWQAANLHIALQELLHFLTMEGVVVG